MMYDRLPRWCSTNLPANAGDLRDLGSIPGWKDPLEYEMATTPGFLTGKFHG